jgi:arylsulfatase A-like enzyme
MKLRPQGPFDLMEELDEWFEWSRDAPFFLFINLFDAHEPYDVRETNPFLPEGLDPLRVRTLQTPGAVSIAADLGMCDLLPKRSDLEILRGLYLGDVQSADAKVARILDALRRRGHDPVTVVTSDHGEHLGEHGLLGHEYTVRRHALHVPLIVHGAPDLAVGRVDVPVALADVSASLLAWAGLPADPEAAGAPLPSPGEGGDAGRALTSMYGDARKEIPAKIGLGLDERTEGRKRAGCRPQHGVFGDLFALTKPPYKLVELGDLPPQLYDLRWDLDERSDIAPHHPEIVEAMTRELRGFRERVSETRGVEPDAEATEMLRALGYLE